MMKRVLIAACMVLAMAGAAAAQQGITQLHTDALPGQPLRFQFEAGSGIVLDAGAPVAADHDNLTLSHVPPGSGWIVELPAVVTVEGAQRVRVTCTVTNISATAGSPAPLGAVDFRSGGMLGATEHTFETGGPFLGRIVLGVPRALAGPGAVEGINANLVQCVLVAFGARNGVDWRAFEVAEGPYRGRDGIGPSAAQYVLEAGNSRLLSGASFRRQVVLSANGYAMTGQ